jgi:hypothetical protein
MLVEVLVSLVAIFLGFRFVKVDGGVKSITNVPLINHEQCHLLSQFGSLEDLIADEATGLVYFSAGTRDGRLEYFPGLSLSKTTNTTHRVFHDQVYLFDPAAETAVALEIQGDNLGDFVTHGVSLVTGELDNHLFFVNHKRTGSVVSVFKHTKGTTVLKHLHDFKHSAIHTPNSVAAVSPTEVYISNDHWSKMHILRMMEVLLGPLGTTNIVHCQLDPKSLESTCTPAVTKLAYANGLEYIASTNEVISAETTRGRVTRYPVLPGGKLDVTNAHSLYFNVALDNIRRVSGTNDFVVATFPDLERLFPALKDLANYKGTVPARALYLREADGYSHEHVLYNDDGQVLSFVTGYLYAKSAGKLLGGSVLYEGLLVCKVDPKVIGNA